MAHHNVKITTNNIIFTLSLLFLTFMTIGAMAVTLVWSGERLVLLSSYELTVLIFPLKQAILSSILSCCLAIPISRAIFRRDFLLKEYLVSFLGIPFILPTISAIFGLILVFGNNGLLNSLIVFLGLPKLTIYGLPGILIAHVFFNLPLAIRILLLAWNEIPNEQFKLAASLDFTSTDFFRHIELPMLKSALPRLFLLIFLICVTSFSIALTLGGGPSSTTLEVAIYQAVRFQLDFSKAASLACFQFMMCGSVAFLLLMVGKRNSSFKALDLKVKINNSSFFKQGIFDYVWIFLIFCFLLVPLLLLFYHGLAGFFELQTTVFLAALNSLVLSLLSGFFGVLIAFSISLWVGTSVSNSYSKYIEILSIFILASSPIVMGTGIFLMLKSIISFEYLTPLLVICVNVTMSLPFMLRALVPAVSAVEQDLGRLADSLNIEGVDRIRNIIFPRVSSAMGLSFGIGAALSMGDLGVITFFSFGEFQTLPLVIYRLMLSYRIEHAFSAALLLIMICFLLFYFFDLLGKYYASR